MEPALADFTRRTGHLVDAAFGAMGVLQVRLAGGEVPDAVILTVPLRAGAYRNRQCYS